MIFGFIKKYKLEILLSILVFALYFSTRIYHILLLPIFTDEAIYTRWAQIAKNDASWRFISLTDGKAPLFIWIAMISMKFFSDPILASRMVSVGAGFFTCVGLFFLSRELFKSRMVGLVAALLYVLYPFGIVYDRMALYDSLAGAFTVWCLYVAILLTKYVRLDLALILGMLTGASVLNKAGGFFTIYLLPSTLLLFNWRKKHSTGLLVKWIALAMVATILTYLYYAILRLSPNFTTIQIKTAIFIYPFSEWIKHPFQFFWGNLDGLNHWFIGYVQWPIFILILLSTIIPLKFFKEKLLLWIWFILPFIALALFGRVLYPRYILFMTLSLLPLASMSLVVIVRAFRSVYVKILLLFLFLFSYFYTDYFLLYNYANAPIPNADLIQYVSDWPAAGGINEAVSFFKDQAVKGKIYIATEGTFGLLPQTMEMYLFQNSNTTIKGIWPIEENPPQELLNVSKKMPTYVIFYQPCSVCKNIDSPPNGWKVKPIPIIAKTIAKKQIHIFQLFSQ